MFSFYFSDTDMAQSSDNGGLCNFDLSEDPSNPYEEQSETVTVEVMPVPRSIQVDALSIDVDSYLDEAKRPNTKRNESYIIKTFNDCMDTINQLNGTSFKYLLEADIEELPNQIERFFMCLQRKDGKLYNPASYETLYNTLRRVLKYRQHQSVDIKNHAKFTKVYAVVKAKASKATASGLTPGMNSSRDIPPEILADIFAKKTLSRDNGPRPLISLIHFAMTTQLGFRSREVSVDSFLPSISYFFHFSRSVTMSSTKTSFMVLSMTLVSPPSLK